MFWGLWQRASYIYIAAFRVNLEITYFLHGPNSRLGNEHGERDIKWPYQMVSQAVSLRPLVEKCFCDVPKQFLEAYSQQSLYLKCWLNLIFWQPNKKVELKRALSLLAYSYRMPNCQSSQPCPKIKQNSQKESLRKNFQNYLPIYIFFNLWVVCAN